MAACHQPENSAITIRWQAGRATGVFIPQQRIDAVPADSIDQLVSVRLAGKETAMLGNYRRVDDGVVFEPLVPLTRGLSYTVWLRNKRLSSLTVPALTTGDRPTLLAIYPTQDSLPDNLLKIYLHFSRPMREGQSKQFVALLKNKTDTLPNVFLDLQPELWNADRTLLTLWLDPGRIKRDLQPNKLLGAPLQIGTHYQVVIGANWPDAQGASLGKAITKTFLAVQRDSLSPVPKQWTLAQPKAGGVQPLEVAFGEALDHSLLAETLQIVDESGKTVSGAWKFTNEEKRGRFIPDQVWQAGRYRLRIESRLEDLAGNNLNRLFDRDLAKPTASPVPLRSTEISFTVTHRNGRPQRGQ